MHNLLNTRLRTNILSDFEPSLISTTQKTIYYSVLIGTTQPSVTKSSDIFLYK